MFESRVCEEDRPTYFNPFYVAEHADYIYNHALLKESDTMPDSCYMYYQPNLTTDMRSILVDWLIQVHLKYKLLPETLYLTINLLDRYLSKVQVNSTYFQLVGVTCMMIASKYEEIYPPNLDDYE